MENVDKHKIERGRKHASEYNPLKLPDARIGPETAVKAKQSEDYKRYRGCDR